RLESRPHLRDLLFGNREDDADGLGLRDDEQRRVRGGRYHVAGIDETKTDASRDRRGNATVVEVQLCAVDGCLVGFQRRLVLGDGRAWCLQDLLSDGVLRDQRFVALQVDPRVLEG